METGKIEYAPDYKSGKPPKGFGVGGLEFACADGRHRFLTGAPRCGCGAEQNLSVEHARLKDAVVEAAKARRRAKLAEVNGAGDYIERLHATMLAEHKAIDALIAFEKENL